ncbi:MAG: SDR family oxidoreductase [Calditrichaeota bacterium]|nr:SDR family oxidoreductase [Calditrichota bacterium]
MRTLPKDEPPTTLVAGVSPAMLTVAGELIRQNQRVILFFRTKERLQEMLSDASWDRTSMLPLVASVTDGKAVVRAFERIIEWTLRLDSLIYNIGIEPEEEGEDFSGAQLVRIMGQNFYGFVNCFSLALPIFKRIGRGHAVVICGAAALSLDKQPAAYAASRAALQIYLRALRRELEEEKIVVTEMYLGHTPTVRGPRKLSQREIVQGILQALRSRPTKYVIGVQ